MLAAVRRVGEGEQAKLAALLTALGSPLTKRRMRLGRSKKRSAAFDRLYERILNAQEVVTIDDIAEMFSMPTESEWLDLIDDYAADACAEIADEEERDKCIDDRTAEEFGRWHAGVMYVAERLMGEHGLTLEPVGDARYPWELRLVPDPPDWGNVARRILETMNGVGTFEFRNLDEFRETRSICQQPRSSRWRTSDCDRAMAARLRRHHRARDVRQVHAMRPRPRRNPLVIDDATLIALDRLEDLGVHPGAMLGRAQRMTTAEDQYSTVVNWLHHEDRGRLGRVRQYIADARAAALAGWDEADHRDEAYMGTRDAIARAFSVYSDELADHAWYCGDASDTDYLAEFPDTWGAWLRYQFWYEGVPEHDATDKNRLQGDEYRTVLVSASTESRKELADEHGIWVLERHFSAPHPPRGEPWTMGTPYWGEYVYRLKTPEGDEEYFYRNSGERRR